jgi:hypothetical protein
MSLDDGPDLLVVLGERIRHGGEPLVSESIDPSMSVNGNVTSPAGSPVTEPLPATDSRNHAPDTR